LPKGIINEDTAKNNRTCNCTIVPEQSPIYISFSQHPNITSVGPVEFIFINLKGFIEMQKLKYCIIVPTLHYYYFQIAYSNPLVPERSLNFFFRKKDCPTYNALTSELNIQIHFRFFP